MRKQIAIMKQNVYFFQQSKKKKKDGKLEKKEARRRVEVKVKTRIRIICGKNRNKILYC